jgi:hypothetical protein
LCCDSSCVCDIVCIIVDVLKCIYLISPLLLINCLLYFLSFFLFSLSLSVSLSLCLSLSLCRCSIISCPADLFRQERSHCSGRDVGPPQNPQPVCHMQHIPGNMCLLLMFILWTMYLICAAFSCLTQPCSSMRSSCLVCRANSCPQSPACSARLQTATSTRLCALQCLSRPPNAGENSHTLLQCLLTFLHSVLFALHFRRSTIMNPKLSLKSVLSLSSISHLSLSLSLSL